MSSVTVRRVEQFNDRELRELGDVLIDCVEGGASVSFMLPMTRAKSDDYWNGVAISAKRGERVVVVATDEQGAIVGTAQVILSQPENQPHRCDLSKMLVHRRARRGGVGAAVLNAAEAAAREAGKTLLVLDTANPEAERLYARNDWQRSGEIPEYALMPDGAPCATVIYYKYL